MNKNIYITSILFLLVLFDFSSNLFAYMMVFNGIIFLENGETFFNLNSKFILFSQLIWSSTFFFFNFYDTRSTLSRFDEIIKIFPVIYGISVLAITLDIFGLINLYVEYKSLLSYCLLFSFFTMIGRFFIHSFQKYLLKMKIGLNNGNE